jgi:hypothetical protein
MYKSLAAFFRRFVALVKGLKELLELVINFKAATKQNILLDFYQQDQQTKFRILSTHKQRI